MLDEINSALREDVSETGPAMYMWKEGDQYVRREVTTDDIEVRNNLLNGLKEFIENKTKVVPAPGVLQLSKEQYRDLEWALGKSSLESIVTAKEHHCLLYSDDMMIRQVAKSDWHVDGVWTQAVLSFMKDNNNLSSEEYYESLRKLILGNYHFVPLDAEAMFYIIDKNNWVPNAEVSRIFESFYGPTCSENSAIEVLSNLLKKVWVESLSADHKYFILDLSLHALCTGRFGSEVVRKFKRTLRGKFQLIILDYQEIVAQIDVQLGL